MEEATQRGARWRNLADLYHVWYHTYIDIWYHICMFVLEVYKMILADDEGNLHWKYTCILT
jgi:hypothetical protein